MTILWVILAFVIGVGAATVFVMLMGGEDISGYSYNRDKQNNNLPLNLTNDEDVIPFPVTKGGVTFCYQHGIGKDIFAECNWVKMDKKKILSLRDFLEENYNREK